MIKIRCALINVSSIRRRGTSFVLPCFEEKGVVIVWASMMMTVLLGFAGFSVDLGNWYLKIERAQRSADAAALAGAVYLPQDPVTADAVARETLRKNGVEQRFIDSAVIKPVSGKPAQMYVKVTTEAENIFLRFIKISPTSTFSRAGTATWAPTIRMSNFSNVLGNEPVDTRQPANDQWEPASLKLQQRQYWLSIAGPETYQGRGEEYGAARCRLRQFYNDLPDGCTSIYNQSNSFVPPPPGGVWAGAQYTYTVTVERGAPGSTTRIQVYDPAFALTGPFCRQNSSWQGGKTYLLYGATGEPRHNPANSSFCAGDHQYVDNNTNTSVPYNMPTTYFRVYGQDNQPLSSCPNVQAFRPWGPPVGVPYQGQAGLNAYAGDAEFNRVFHKWVTLCDVPQSPSSDHVYKVQVWTGSTGEGVNHFSLRAGLISGGAIQVGASGQYVKLSADEHLPLYSNFVGSDMRFAIAEVPMSMAGRDVYFAAFDIGDCNNCTLANSATFSLESDSRSASSPGQSSTTSCEYTPITNLGSVVPMPGCRITGVWNGGGYDGKKIHIVWHVPSDYRCGGSTATSCFLFMRVNFAGGTTEVDDSNTWSLENNGAPIHLVPNPIRP